MKKKGFLGQLTPSSLVLLRSYELQDEKEEHKETVVVNDAIGLGSSKYFSLFFFGDIFKLSS